MNRPMRLTRQYLYIIVLTTLMTTCVFAEDIQWDKLVEAVILVESGGNPSAVGTSGEIGLMQISPIVLREFNENIAPLFSVYYYLSGSTSLSGDGDYMYIFSPPDERFDIPLKKEDLFNRHVNETVGLWYLHRIWNKYMKYETRTLEKLLASYNCGFSRAKKKPYPISTQKYIRKVKAIYDKAIQ